MKDCFFRYLGVMLLFLSGAETCHAEFYTTLRLPQLSDGRMVSLINTDTEVVLDSLPVSNGTVVFRSDRYEPAVIRVAVGKDSYGTFLLNNSPITLNVTEEEIEGGVRRTWEAHGGYNDSIDALNRQIFNLRTNLRYATTDQARDSIQNAIYSTLLRKIADNADNILGYRLWLMCERELPFDSLETILNLNPDLNNYRQIKAVVAQKRALAATRKGNKFSDFSVSYGGDEHKLSDVVGKGDYVLLDFWAFWCAPCRAEMPYIKEVFNRYKDKNFKVIGVAVSDTPEKDLKAAEDLSLPWDTWVNAGADVMNVYSIRSIPHLILFGPDGTILERDFHKENIMPTVAKYLD